jgi:hypothetical protein
MFPLGECAMATDKTAVALRVMTAIHDGNAPEERDLLLLRAYLPDHRDCDPDEQACFVIQEALKRWKEEGDKKKGSERVA